MEKREIIKIKEYTTFRFVHQENAERVAIALVSSGYFVRIVRASGEYLAYVYGQNN